MKPIHSYFLWYLSLHTSIADALSSAAQTTLAAGHQLFIESWQSFNSHLLNKFDPVQIFIVNSANVMTAGRVVRLILSHDSAACALC